MKWTTILIGGLVLVILIITGYGLYKASQGPQEGDSGDNAPLIPTGGDPSALVADYHATGLAALPIVQHLQGKTQWIADHQAEIDAAPRIHGMTPEMSRFYYIQTHYPG